MRGTRGSGSVNSVQALKKLDADGMSQSIAASLCWFFFTFMLLAFAKHSPVSLLGAVVASPVSRGFFFVCQFRAFALKATRPVPPRPATCSTCVCGSHPKPFVVRRGPRGSMRR